MAIKNLLPMAARNRLRPAYQRACKFIEHAGSSLRRSAMWPKPKEWTDTRRELENITDIKELYEHAHREFGLFQHEREIVPFLEYVRSKSPKIVGEIGILFGGNTFLFERVLSEARRLIAVDIKLNNAEKLIYMAPRGQRVTLFEASSYSDETVARVKRSLGSDRFDFLFIDGDHSYSGVARDFLQYYPLVRSGGMIAFHDIAPDELARFGRRTPGVLENGGEVYALWNQLRIEFECKEFINDPAQYGFGIGILIKPDDKPLKPSLVELLSSRVISAAN